MKVLGAVHVYGKRYPVVEKSGILKAHLFDTFGWTQVWAESYTQLVRRIKFALDQR